MSFPDWMQYYACQVQSSARSQLQQLSSYTTLVKLQLDSLFYLNAMCAHQAALAARPTASCARGRRCAASLARYVCVSSRQERTREGGGRSIATAVVTRRAELSRRRWSRTSLPALTLADPCTTTRLSVDHLWAGPYAGLRRRCWPGGALPEGEPR